MLASLASAILAVLPAQLSAPPGPPAGAQGEAAQVPLAYARWLDEVDELGGRGELDGAREHLAALLEADPHLALIDAPDEVALPALERLDDVAGACGVLEVQLHARQERERRLSETLEDGDPALLRARLDLAATMYGMGDLAGARALEEAVLEARERTLPEDHPDLLRARLNLAVTLSAMGDLAGARTLEEAVLDVFEGTLPPDHADLLDARQNLAATMARMGDLAGARGLFEAVLEARERTLPRDHPDLLDARQNLAGVRHAMGDLAGARGLYEAVLEARERTLAEGHPDLDSVRGNLAVAMAQMGDLAGARGLFEAVLEARERTLPEDHPDLLAARTNLAVTMEAMGDLAGARALEEAVLEARERMLPEDHPDLLTARQNMASTLRAMGDLADARALEEAVLEASERFLPEDHPDLLLARQNLAVTMKRMGDLAGARSVFESVLEARQRTLPADHPDLLAARRNLAVTMKEMGDLAGARALFELVLEASERTLPDDHPGLLDARQNLAATTAQMGDLADARGLFEVVLEARERILPEDHPDRLTAQENLAATIYGMGDLTGARALFEEVIEAHERTLPEDHPDLLDARQNLAETAVAMGDLSVARALSEAVLEARERILPEDHPDLLDARRILAVAMLAMGDRADAHGLGLDLARGMLRRLELVSTLSPRGAREAAHAEAHRHSMVRLLTRPAESENAEALRFDLAETLRATASVSRRGAGGSGPLRREIAAVRGQLNDLVSGGPREGQSSEAFAAAVSELTFERDRIERAMRSELTSAGIVVGKVTHDAVAEALPADGAAVGFLRHEKWMLDPAASGVRSAGDVLAAHVVSPDGTLTELELGSAGEIADLATSWRSAIGVPLRARGVAVFDAGAAGDEELALGSELRARVLDPVLDAVGDAQRIFVSLDDVLFTVPIEALPSGEGDARLGDRVQFVHEVSFARLLSSREVPAGEPGALLVGDVAYDGTGASGETAVSAPLEGLRSGSAAAFSPLPSTGPEARAIAERFGETFDHEAVLLSEDAATKGAFHEHAPGRRYVHVATHGWFAPETVSSTLDAKPAEDALWSRLGARETVTGLAPMTLCGLAFAGANLGRDSLGRVPGIMTAEELAGIDLSECELAVLSACETNVGIRRAGQGIQSLQAALHAAGARSSITSLWKVDDAATRKLFEHFYTYLWLEGMPKAEALWKAKCDLRAEGHPVRDWAAWVLSGDPD